MSACLLPLPTPPLTLFALLHGHVALDSGADRLPEAPTRRLHGQLRLNATRWLGGHGRAAAGLPEALTATDMMEALGCGDGAFQRWLDAGLVPGGRTDWGSPWQCATVTFVCWLGQDRYWFEPGEVGR